jgi:hypothetical protein
LTFGASDSIYESQCDFSNRKFELGESIDEERNQEGRCKEKGCSEEKEVACQRPLEGRPLYNTRPRQRGLFLLRPGDGAFFILCAPAPDCS